MRPDEAGALRAIDVAATQLLREAGWPELPDAPPLDRYAPWLAAHDVFVAEAGGRAVGFAAACELPGIGAEGSCYWLAELSVDPGFGRRGVGSALLDAVLGHARWLFHRAVALSTFREVPFNAPFYERRGFIQVPRQDRTASLEERFRAELPSGVPEAARTLMVRWL